jgi:AbrB family looped-hinge helix DNA binding protein
MLSGMPRVTSKGQVTIPVTIRYALGIAPGDDVVFTVRDGVGQFRRADGVLGREASLGLEPRTDASDLERLLCVGDPTLHAAVLEARNTRRRIPIPDVVVLDVLRHALRSGIPADLVAECFHDVAAERAFRLGHARAVRAAVDAVVAGSDPVAAYTAART